MYKIGDKVRLVKVGEYWYDAKRDINKVGVIVSVRPYCREYDYGIYIIDGRLLQQSMDNKLVTWFVNNEHIEPVYCVNQQLEFEFMRK